jgi:hypothetical protein
MLFVLPKGQERILGVKARLVTRIFVAGDVISFLVQSSGIGLASSQNWEGNSGINILLAGLSTQLATNVIFMGLLIAFYKKTVLEGIVSRQAPAGWKKTMWAIIVTMILILVSLLFAAYDDKLIT